jgi:hypothetical protein
MLPCDAPGAASDLFIAFIRACYPRGIPLGLPRVLLLQWARDWADERALKGDDEIRQLRKTVLLAAASKWN